MKKYFTKYLPVEEEVKEGELGLSPTTSTIHVYHNSYDEIGWKKVKLFLCSRDIQIGDDIYDNVGRLWKNCEKCFYKVMKEQGYGFKVIGEVSPDALSYAEGMEFDENEVILWQKPKFKENWESLPFEGKNRTDLRTQTIYPHSPSFSNLAWEILNPSSEQILVEIKCPTCKHFH